MTYVVTFHFHKVTIHIVQDARSRLDAIHRAWGRRDAFSAPPEHTDEECLFRIDVETEGERYGFVDHHDKRHPGGL